MTITKADLAAVIWEHSGGLLSGADRAIDAVIERIIGAVRDGEDVQIRGFATISAVHRPARTNARNPRTGEEVSIPARTGVRFKAARPFVDALNGR